MPAGGDLPDPALNPKFAHKLDFLDELRGWFAEKPPERAILVGDLNVAPREDDVWSHKQLLKIVSHTPVEVGPGRGAGRRRLDRRDAGAYSRRPALFLVDLPSPDWQAADKGRRLDHVWATPDLAERSGGSRIARHVRGWARRPTMCRSSRSSTHDRRPSTARSAASSLTGRRRTTPSTRPHAELRAMLDEWAGKRMRALVVTGRGRSFCSGAALGDVAGADWTENPLTAACDALEASRRDDRRAERRRLWRRRGAGACLRLPRRRRGHAGVRAAGAARDPLRAGGHPAGDRAVGARARGECFCSARPSTRRRCWRRGFWTIWSRPRRWRPRPPRSPITLAEQAPLAVRGMKRTILELREGSLDAEAAKARVAACFASADHAEGLAAQRERRAPRFTGRLTEPRALLRRLFDVAVAAALPERRVPRSSAAAAFGTDGGGGRRQGRGAARPRLEAVWDGPLRGWS